MPRPTVGNGRDASREPAPPVTPEAPTSPAKPAPGAKPVSGAKPAPGAKSSQGAKPAKGAKSAPGAKSARGVVPAPGTTPPAPVPPAAASTPSTPSATEVPTRPYLVVSYALGVVVGVLLGVFGVFLVPSGPRPGGTLISVGLLLALLGNPAVALLVRWLTGTRLGAMIPLVGWIPVVLLLASSRTEGDLVLRSTATGYLFLAVGVLSPVVVAVIGRARRGLTALPPLPHTAPPPR